MVTYPNLSHIKHLVVPMAFFIEHSSAFLMIRKFTSLGDICFVDSTSWSGPGYIGTAEILHVLAEFIYTPSSSYSSEDFLSSNFKALLDYFNGVSFPVILETRINHFRTHDMCYMLIPDQASAFGYKMIMVERLKYTILPPIRGATEDLEEYVERLRTFKLRRDNWFDVDFHWDMEADTDIDLQEE
ncbi:hypothetical protein EJ08DRAFT_455652 [Tothia fuscella]|uniref:Uncharacterized protein n=1 Tax=Tothia fuscella TaxID=1048955 RepID=A0A9P4TUY1_9PEZI|nr:hypothetical protein EJ08DRAFT_455652 [Tothia fuscella]